MWKRENEPATPATPSPMSTPPPAAPAAAPRSENEAPRPAAASGERAVLSPSIVLRGEISGDEDLLVEGRVEGKVMLRQNVVTVGAKGRVAAEVHARAILIEGEIEGNLAAEEQIVLRKSARVRGDLVAPRVTIEDGARFKGTIDMDPKQRSGAAPAPTPAAATRPGGKEESGPRPVDSKSTAQAG
ncbi:MAG: polymer-forming cytoskeletal protein [Thermoanaerobaculia bacterium]|jgi:cytoskeletal protein CcmA (bactofilin family)|nr:polymer-forming cytoskeletal protein [Thermoanaerobaculia bacterium]